MPTSTNVTNLKINTLTKAQYDTAVQGGVIGPNELSIITDLDESIQVTTLPTASAGELGKIYQFVGATDATYTNGYFYKCVSDGQTPATYSWEQTDVMPAGSSLPDQTGQSGKFLTTDGTDASWSDKPLVNKATGSQSIGIGQFQYQTSGSNSIAIGDHSGASGDRSVALGSSARGDTNYTVSVGPYANIHYGTVQSKAYSTAVGASAMSKGLYSVSLGCTAVTEATGGIQIGYGTNSEAGTLSIGLTTATSPWTSTNYKLLDSDGTIPTARFTTDPVSDGTYYPTLTISSGTPTRSWSTIAALQNTATGTDSLTVLGTATSSLESINIGLASEVRDDYSVVYGNNARTNYSENSVVVGFNAAAIDILGTQQYFNTVCGYASQIRGASNGIAIGNQAFVGANGAMQFGCGANTEAGTVCFALTTTNDDSNFTNYKLMDSDGTIPEARLADMTNASQGQVLALDSNLGAVWVTPSGGGSVSSVNGQTGSVVLTAKDVEAVPQYTTMPAASASNLGDIVQFVGATGTYTSGYFYESSTTGTPSSATAAQTVGTGLTDITVDLQTLESVLVDDYELSLTDGTITIVCVDAEENYWDASIAIGEGSGSSDTDPSEFGVTYSGGSIAVGDTIVVTYTANSETSAWVRKDVQPAPEALPDQTGQNGKFLTTNGTSASWGDALTNKATGNHSLAIYTAFPASSANTVQIGHESYVGGNSATVVGVDATAGYYGVAFGRQAGAAVSHAVAVGAKAVAGGVHSVQIGSTGNTTTNPDDDTVKFANTNGNFEIMSADGTIPTARLTKVNSTITLTAAGWSNGSQTVNVTGMTTTGVVFVSPDPTDQADYTSGGVQCTAQGSGTLTFTCATAPTNDIDVNIVML